MTTTGRRKVEPVGNWMTTETFFPVDPDEIAEILSMPIPAHTTVFDEDLFRDFVARSISLVRDEKVEIIRAIPRLTQDQVDAIIWIVRFERAELLEINRRFDRKLTELERLVGLRPGRP